MPLEILYSSEFYKVEVDRENKVLHSIWLRSVSRSEVEKGGMKLYESLLNTRFEHVIADMRILSALDSETKEWMASNFYSYLSKTSLKKLARVLPDNVFHRISLESVATRAEALGITKFEVKNFKEMNEALNWLQTDKISLSLS